MLGFRRRGVELSMLLGSLIIGWIGAVLATSLYLVAGEGSWLWAIGVFTGVGNLTVLCVAAACAVRCALSERREDLHGLAAPVYALVRQARADTPTRGSR